MHKVIMWIGDCKLIHADSTENCNESTLATYLYKYPLHKGLFTPLTCMYGQCHEND